MPEESLAEKEGLNDREFIVECYKQLLGREPDEEGMTNWLGNIERGQPREEIEKYFRNITEAKNHAIEMIKGSKDKKPGEVVISKNPLEQIAEEMNPDDKFRIMYCMPQTAGDVLLSTAVIKALKEKYPEATIYFATEKRYFPILKDNPVISKVFEYDDNLLNYRSAEPFGPARGFVDLCFCPFIVTQRIPHWIHGGKGDSLAVTYGHLCGLSLTDDEVRKKIRIGKEPVELPFEGKYITFHAKTTQDPKDYSNWEEVFSRVHGVKIVQIGSKDEPLLEHPDVVDMRGETTPQQLAYLIENAALHVGLDSFPAHVASAVNTRSIVVYGGTYARQGGIQNSKAIEPENRSGCYTSCHLVECIQKKQGKPKCIDNIVPDTIVDAMREELGNEHIKPPKPINISAYCIIKNGNENRFPYIACIKEALKVADEFVIVDGGSTDGTFEDLQFLAKNEPKLKVLQHEWDMDDPMLMGNEKTWARQQCTGEYLIQLDADEMLVEPHPGQIRDLIRANRKVPIFDFPVINMYGGDNTIRVDDSIWKWRLSKNDPKIIHGVYGEARDFDPETMQVVFDKRKSDGCEYIDRDTLAIAPHVSILPPQAAKLHIEVVKLFREGQEVPAEFLENYKTMMQQISEAMPHIVHYSWADLETKKKRGGFWSSTYHGRNSWTHNTTEDIEERIKEDKELILQVDMQHPLKGAFKCSI
jgi:ADP-heptose:LPS heptosyltransferase